jgi:lysyl endopeptidase
VELFLYSEDKSVVMGPIDFSNRGQSHEFWTDLLPGSAVVLELIGENEALEKAKLNISKVVHGYINTFSDSGGFGQSAPCNIDIDCPIGQPFGQESNAVARLLVNNGLGFCSGAIINNTCNDLNPYLLTANHCLDPSVNNWGFRFQYRSPNPQCDGMGGGTDNFVNIFYNGADVRANNQNTDFALLALNTNPTHQNLSYLG